MIVDLKRLQKKHANRHPSRKAVAPAPVAPAPVAPAPEAVAPVAVAPEAPAPEAPAPAPEAVPPEAEKLSMLNTKTELTDAAIAAGVDLQGGWTKAQILAALYPEG